MPTVGFEPTTSRLSSECSTTELREQTGSPAWSRTKNLPVNSRALYPLSYREKTGLDGPIARASPRPSAHCFAMSWSAKPTRANGRGLAPTDLQSVAFDHLATSRKEWLRTTGSNREPSALEAAALPIELARICLVGADGFEPPCPFGKLRYRQLQSASLPHTHESWCLVHDSNMHLPAS